MKYEIRYGKAEPGGIRHAPNRQPLDPDLVNEIGTRMLERRPQLAEVSLWDPGEGFETDPKVKTCADPRPPFGRIGLVMRR